MSSSSEFRAARPDTAGPTAVAPAESAAGAGLRSLPLPELRRGGWTRLGGSSVLGDQLTESLLGELAEQARSAATAQGYAVGWAQGRREAAAEAAEREAVVAARRAAEDERREAEHREALAGIGRAADEVRGLLADLAGSLEEQGTELAFALVAELLGHQVRLEGGADVVRRVLAVLPDRPLATVRLSPAAADSPAATELAERGVEVRRDAALGRGDAVVECDGSIVDLRLDRALERVRAALDVASDGASGVAER
ncbi:hypothetical protein E8D34_15425 [Nocardioides sp. GY 10113]|uniref:FliH/SctL family protein n=1 Tax=Nocardioides sp. GY 10113 TaxID=2569761 RepID=UPI0010A8176C|nr:hypothetical protein [Nocardioides sp. GY 10113]TIC83521.1 hypothetical protein E8D34_15425 [Nocardioides sp. GY 10113]